MGVRQLWGRYPCDPIIVVQSLVGLAGFWCKTAGHCAPNKSVCVSFWVPVPFGCLVGGSGGPVEMVSRAR